MSNSDEFMDYSGSDGFESGYTDPENVFNQDTTPVYTGGSGTFDETTGGAYNPNLDPNIPGGHDPRLDTYGTGPGSASAGNDANGAPTIEDYNRAVSFYGKEYTDQMFKQILKDSPSYAAAIARYAPSLVNSSGSGSPTGTTPGGGPGGGNPLGTTNMGLLIPALAQAFQQWNQAGQYTDMAEKYAGQLNPYGAYRDAAAQKLKALQEDPSSIQDTPGYKFALQQGLGSVANRDNRSFGVGAGSTNPDMMNYAQGLASKTYNDTIKQYSDQAGVGIGPSAAAGMLQTGLQGRMGAQNQALQALFTPFGPGNNTGGSGNGGFDLSSIDWNSILNSANGQGGSTGTQNTEQTTDPNLPPSNGAYGSYTGGA